MGDLFEPDAIFALARDQVHHRLAARTGQTAQCLDHPVLALVSVAGIQPRDAKQHAAPGHAEPLLRQRAVARDKGWPHHIGQNKAVIHDSCLPTIARFSISADAQHHV